MTILAAKTGTSKGEQQPIGKMIGIQYLRGIAATMVVVYHLPTQLRHMGYGGPWLPGLSGGVDIFFVISGFIMWAMTARQPELRPIDFWRGRLTRIAPLYWIVTGFTSAMMLLAPHMLQSLRFDLWHVVASFLFIAARRPVTHTIEPVVVPGWTLNYEMFFYLIFGTLLLVRPAWRFAGTVGVLIALVALGNLTGTPAMSLAGFYTADVMLEFALGMTIAAFASRLDGMGKLGACIGGLMMVISLIFIIFSPELSAVPRSLVRGLPAAIVVLGVIMIEAHHRRPRIPGLHMLGDASYSIYLSHALILSASSQLWRRFGLNALPYGVFLYAVVAVIASLVGGWLLYRFVEQPLIRKSRRQSTRAFPRSASI